MTDFDTRDELYKRQDREEELKRVSFPVTEYNMNDTIKIHVPSSCTQCEAIQELITFCLNNKDRWGDSEESFRHISWAVDKSKEFLTHAEETFKQAQPRIIDVKYWTTDR